MAQKQVSRLSRLWRQPRHWWRGWRQRDDLKKEVKKNRRYVRRLLYVTIVVVAIFSYATNPFVRFSVVVDPYQEVSFAEGQFQVEQNDELFLRDAAFFQQLAVVKSGWHIISSKFTGGPKASERKVDDIIREIHALRFNPELPFLISGDHFSVLYPRSLGIFYHTILDPRTALDAQDWENRQRIYLKTTAYALQVYSQSDRLSTTIVPIGPKSVALMNIYDPPSDTLYSLVYALKSMQDTAFLRQNYPFETQEGEQYSLATVQASQQLTQQYRDDLARHWTTFLEDILDSETNLIRRDIRLSGTKDIVHRESALYDNVMVWRTAQLLQQLGVLDEDPAFLEAYKQHIIDNYWLPEEGFFLEDLSDRGREETLYSSDWLIMYQTGMLSPEVEQEREYLERTVEYIQRNAIDQPFALQYQPDPRPYQLYLPVRLGAPAYGSTAIWSNWGMEYIKLLTHLAQVTGEEVYLAQATDQLASYTYNIKRYRGYPEVYDENGDFFRTPFYKSIRQTGWVVTYEQARAMLNWTRENWNPSATSGL